MKSIDHKYMHLFICILCSIPFTCMSTLTQVAHSLDYCNFVVSFENEKCASYNMFFFYNIVYTILCLLNFHMNLRISSNFCKNKKSPMRKQTSAGCPRALGLEADALSSARPVRTLPCPGHAESTGVL